MEVSMRSLAGSTEKKQHQNYESQKVKVQHFQIKHEQHTMAYHRWWTILQESQLLFLLLAYSSQGEQILLEFH